MTNSILVEDFFFSVTSVPTVKANNQSCATD